MDTPTRRSVRARPSVSYIDSPNEEKTANSAKPSRKSKRSNFPDDNDNSETSNASKTPTASKSAAKFSPKKLRVTRTPSTQSLESIVSENSPATIKIDTPTSSRKSIRVRTPNRRYSNINLKINLKEKSVQRLNDANSEGSESVILSSEDEGESTDKENVEKSETLSKEEDGQKVNSFKTPKKTDGTNTPKTPKSVLIKSSKMPKMPKTLNNQRLSILKKTPTSSKTTPRTETGSIILSSSENEAEDESTDNENVEKPTTLFDEMEDVEGHKVYSFKTQKSKNRMAILASNTPKTPKSESVNTSNTPKTPNHRRISVLMKTPTSSRTTPSLPAKTPTHVRTTIKKNLDKVKLRQYVSDDEEDFSPDCSSSDSESTDSSSSEKDDNNPSDHEKTPPPKKPQSLAVRLLKTPSVATSNAIRRSARTQQQFILQSDDYFSTQTTKSKTSDHTLDRLKTPRLPHDQLIKLLSNMELSKDHENAIKDLNDEYKLHFDRWLTLFDEGYTVLLFGLGSKRNILQAFHKEKIANQHVLVINGFFPSLTIKDILDGITTDILEITSTSGNPHEVVKAIEDEMKSIPALHIFLIIHNLDGTMLRNKRAQNVLSRLASIERIHMIASIDHLNAPLLWNNTKLSNYNFSWWDVTSLLPYTEETAFENSLLTHNSGALELSSMKSVFQSLTSNARGIYILLVKYQLKNSGAPNYQGISFKELYSTCREAFLVSSDIALRAQLTEFLDHKLAKMKRSVDGSENIKIPIKNFLLEQFLSEEK